MHVQMVVFYCKDIIFLIYSAVTQTQFANGVRAQHKVAIKFLPHIASNRSVNVLLSM